MQGQKSFKVSPLLSLSLIKQGHKSSTFVNIQDSYIYSIPEQTLHAKNKKTSNTDT